MKRLKIIISFVIVLAIIFALYCKFSIHEYQDSLFYMDTYINIKLYTNKSKKQVDKVFKEIDYLYDTYHKLVDRYNFYDGYINVYYLNEILKNDEEVLIDKRLSEIIKLGLDYYDKSDGLVNIAMGNLTSVWKNYIEKQSGLPTDEELEVNINIADINLKDNIYTKKNDVKLDLGSIAKGYVTEIVGDYLESLNINSYIINAGGNVKAGKAKLKDYFVVGITNPIKKDEIFTKIKINNLSVVTSGDYQRYYEYNGTIYHHIINPNTKYPENNVRSVTVVTEDSSYADFLSTYLFLCDKNKAIDIVNNLDATEAIIYDYDNQILKSKGFDYDKK